MHNPDLLSSSSFLDHPSEPLPLTPSLAGRLAAPPPTPMASCSSSVDMADMFAKAMKIPDLDFTEAMTLKITASRLRLSGEGEEEEEEEKEEGEGDGDKEDSVEMMMIDMQQIGQGGIQAAMRIGARENGRFYLKSHGICFTKIHQLQTIPPSQEQEHEHEHEEEDDEEDKGLTGEHPFFICTRGVHLYSLKRHPVLRAALMDYAAAMEQRVVLEILGALAKGPVTDSATVSAQQIIQTQYMLVLCVLSGDSQQGRLCSYDHNCPALKSNLYFLCIIHEGEEADPLLVTVGSLLQDGSGGRRHKFKSSGGNQSGRQRCLFLFTLVPNSNSCVTHKYDCKNDTEENDDG